VNTTDSEGASPPVPEKTDPRLHATAALGVAWALLPALFGFLLLGSIGVAGDWLRDDMVRGAIVFAVLFAITSGLGLLPTYAQAVLGGWVFGLIGGVPLALAGFAGGALIGYGLTRVIGRDALAQRIAKHPKSDAISRALIGRGAARTTAVVALLRCPPNSPFALTNLVMAGGGVRFVPFIIGTCLGMLPRTAVMVGVGAAGAATGARDLQALVRDKGAWFLIAAIASTIVVLMILSALSKRALVGIEAEASRTVDRNKPGSTTRPLVGGDSEV